jgi:multiple sugar transport system ATP-binding protein
MTIKRGERHANMAAIVLRELTKTFDDGTVAVDGLSLEVSQGEFMVLVGPTGCGKSTVLRLVAGLDSPSSGHIYLDGQQVDHAPPSERDVAMVFQDYALYPHLTVGDNIAFPLQVAQLGEAEVTARVREVADLLGIGALLRRLPGHLSGGQRQRVAMARAVVRRPTAFLLDEPLSNLDAHLREDLRAEIVQLSRAYGVTTLYVTHDRTEALTMADRVAVLRRGRLQQLGPPGEVYGDPANVFVAAFLGPGQTSMVLGAVYVEPDGTVALDLGTQVLRLAGDDPRAAVLATHHTARLTVGVRADALSIVEAETAGPQDLRGVVRMVEDLGHEAVVHVDTGAAPAASATTMLDLPESTGDLAQLMAEEPPTVGGFRRTLSRVVPYANRPTPPPTARTEYGFYPRYEAETRPAPRGDLLLRVPRAAMPRRGDRLALTLDLDRVYLFDRDGRRIRF